jgi:hypothetical protein
VSKKIEIQILEDAYAKKVRAVSVAGTRVTPAKGSGQWNVVATWIVDADVVREALEEEE